MPTYYQILSIPETASQQEIKSAFRRLSLQYHPDRNNGDKYAEAKFREVLEAYKLLSDPDKKVWYDRRLFYQRQPPPPQTQPQPQPASGPVYRRRSARQILTDYYGTNDEYVQPDFSRMPWKFMGIMIVGFILFFVLLYNFGPKPRSPYEEFQETAPVKFTPLAVADVMDRKLKLQDGSYSSVADIIAKHPGANVVELFPDIDGDGMKDLQLTITYPGAGTLFSQDYIFRNPLTATFTGTIDENGLVFEEFFMHTGGMYIVGNNLRLYFDKAIETYHNCISCDIKTLPNDLVPAIYLKAKDGRIWFAETNEKRNRQIEENLAYLQSRGIPDLENYIDDGTRKEYLRLIVSYYFNNRDSRATEMLFRKYYDGKDADIVWEDASNIIKTYVQKITSNAAFRNTEVF